MLHFTGVALAVLCATVGSCTPAPPTHDHAMGPFPVPLPRHGDKWATGDEPVGKGWREPMLYVDGEPRACLRVAEFPSSLTPVMRREEINVEIVPGQPTPPPAFELRRAWRVVDLLTSLGVEVSAVQMVVFHASNERATAIAGDELRRRRDAYQFDLTDGDAGFVRLITPNDGVHNGMFDKYAGVSVFVTKTPPTLDGDHLLLHGAPVVGVPYFGQPQRGGVRIYVDDRLTTVIKRNLLPTAEAKHPLLEVLGRQGVATAALRACTVVANGKRGTRLAAGALRAAHFTAGSGASGAIALDDGTMIQAMLCHTR